MSLVFKEKTVLDLQVVLKVKNSDIQRLNVDNEELRKHVTELNNNINGLKKENYDLRKGIAQLNGKIDDMTNLIKSQNSKQSPRIWIVGVPMVILPIMAYCCQNNFHTKKDNNLNTIWSSNYSKSLHRFHYQYIKQIPAIYRLKCGIYYPYIAFELITDELNDFYSTWISSKKLPLLPMTINERLIYRNIFITIISTIVLCSFIDQFRQLIDFLQDSQSSNKENQNRQKYFARFSIGVKHESIRDINILNSEVRTKYKHNPFLFLTQKCLLSCFKYNLLRSTAFPSLINWLYIYDNKCLNVHNQSHERNVSLLNTHS
ncbi:hypothetical protein I4U23_010300 [Adineta vaga]|nr:hypothetical protein I4U23_010300 [Adineta vaga]